MSSFIDPQNGDLATAEHVAQLVENFQGLRNIPISLSGINDAATYALTLKNAGTGSRDLIAYAADGTTVLLQVDASGVTLGSPVNVPPGSISGTAIAPGSITNAMLGADVARDNQLTNPGFEVWSRGVGPFTSNGTYGADRWAIYPFGTDTLSVSRNTANADVGSLACMQVVFTLGTGAGASGISQLDMATDGYQYQGKSLFLSVRVRASVANAVRLALVNNEAGGGTAVSNYHSGSGAYETLVAGPLAMLPAATRLDCAIRFAASCTAYVDNANLVVGTAAANYVPMHPADDLARCLRYYEVIGDVNTFPIIGGYSSAGGPVYANLLWAVKKAITPTVTKNGTWGVNNAGQPTLNTPSLGGVTAQVAVTALGVGYAYSGGVGQNLSVEGNP
jgi:hypothetical protein